MQHTVEIVMLFSVFIFASFYLFVELQPHVRGWLLASIDGQKTGMVPANYIRVLGKRRGTKHLESHPAKLTDQLSSTSDRMQRDVQRQQASTVSADNDWSFDDANC